MEDSFKIPLYAQVALISICLIAFVLFLSIGEHIIVPIIYASIIGVLVNPIVNFLVRKKWNRIISISITVVLTVSVVIAFFYLIYSQLTMFSETYPQLKEKFNSTTLAAVRWASGTFKISQSKIFTWINETEMETINNFEIGEKLSEVGQMIFTAVLLPVYLFMILFYKPLLLEFIRRLFRSEYHVAVADVLLSTKKIIQSYLVGLFFELIIIAILNSVGLLIIGIDYAIILGIIGAILNIIPYIGGIIAVALPVIIAFITKDSLSYPLLVVLIYLLIQFIDNHFIIPKIVASRVQLNALISIIAVLIGGALWGITGMFLSIPLTAILKVIFDHIEPLKPWGFLLGNIVPTSPRFSLNRQRIKTSND